MLATLLLYAAIVAAAPIQDAYSSTPTPAPKTGAGVPRTPKKDRADSAMTPTDAKARIKEREQFDRFSKLLAAIIDPVKFSTLDAEKITLMLGQKVAKNETLSDDIFMVIYESKGFDREWGFHKPTKPFVSPPMSGASEFIEGFELSIAGRTLTTKHRFVGLNVKQGIHFTVADFKGFFKQEPSKPRPFPHPIPPERQMDVHLFVRDGIVVSVVCDKKNGYCLGIGINNDPDEVRRATASTGAKKAE